MRRHALPAGSSACFPQRTWMHTNMNNSHVQTYTTFKPYNNTHIPSGEGGARRNQQPRGGGVALLRRKMQRGLAGGVGRVRVRALAQQQAEHLRACEVGSGRGDIGGRELVGARAWGRVRACALRAACVGGRAGVQVSVLRGFRCPVSGAVSVSSGRRFEHRRGARRASGRSSAGAGGAHGAAGGLRSAHLQASHPPRRGAPTPQL